MPFWQRDEDIPSLESELGRRCLERTRRAEAALVGDRHHHGQARRIVDEDLEVLVAGVGVAVVRCSSATLAGLDGLRQRLAEYRGLGARFSKWRAVITIGEDIPSEYCIWTNAHALARFASLSQEAGLLPIVEPEVLMDGDHGIGRSFDVTSRTLHAVFTELRDQRVHLEVMLLKPNMSSPAPSRPNRRHRPRSQSGRCGACIVTSPPPYPGSSSCRAGSRMRMRQRTSTR